MTTKVGIDGAVDLAHPDLADLGSDFIWADACASLGAIRLYGKTDHRLQ